MSFSSFSTKGIPLFALRINDIASRIHLLVIEQYNHSPFYHFTSELIIRNIGKNANMYLLENVATLLELLRCKVTPCNDLRFE